MITKVRVYAMLFIFSVGCNGKPDSAVNPETETLVALDEVVVDSLSLGKDGSFKIQVRQFQNADGETRVAFDLFRKENGQWQNTQTFQMQKDPLTTLGLSFSDFNSDGRKDMTFLSGSAARPSNDIKSLFLFDETAGQFRLIRNSTNFPNLRYNDELNCVDAWLLYGGTTTVFLRIEGDSLREFAGVELYDDTRTVYEIDVDGNKTILQTEQIKDLDVNTRYKTYNPLKARF